MIVAECSIESLDHDHDGGSVLQVEQIHFTRAILSTTDADYNDDESGKRDEDDYPSATLEGLVKLVHFKPYNGKTMQCILSGIVSITCVCMYFKALKGA